LIMGSATVDPLAGRDAMSAAITTAYTMMSAVAGPPTARVTA